MSVNRILTLLAIITTLSACSSGEPADVTQADAPAPSAGEQTIEQMSARQMQMWAGSCALCHVDGNAFAPRIGNGEEWSPRLAKGRHVLVENTINGLNDMPPLGYCMACEREDFAAMIDFMTAGVAGGGAQ